MKIKMWSRGPKPTPGPGVDSKGAAPASAARSVSGFESREAELRALNLLVHEAATEPTPELDWSHVEAGLLERIAREPCRGLGGHARLEAPAAASARAAPGTPWMTGRPRKVRPEIARGAPGFAQAIWMAGCAVACATMLVHGGAPSEGRGTRLSHRASPEASQRLVRSGNLTTNDASTLSAMGIIETREVAFSYDVPGLARARVAPGSAIRILPHATPPCPGGARPMTVELLRGSIHAEVVPNGECETFAVEVDRTRIAAHGTRFDVTREHDSALVEVDQGAIAVGPVTHRETTQGWLVTAPNRASFSLNGAKESRWLPPLPGWDLADADAALADASEVDAPEWDPTQGPPGSLDHEDATTGGAELSPVPSPSGEHDSYDAATDGRPRRRSGRSSARLPLVAASAASAAARAERLEPRAPEAASVQGLLHGIRACYRKQLAATQLEFSVHSTLRLVIGKDGAVEQGVFRPPLSPTLMACATSLVRTVRFAQSTVRSTLDVSIDLTP